MPILEAIAIGLASAAVPASFLGWRRIRTRREERAVREPISAHLDELIRRASEREGSIYDLSPHQGHDDAGRVVSRSYSVYVEPTVVCYVNMRKFLRDHRRKWRYAIDFEHPALEYGRFPEYARDCRSPWFVKRMEKLFSLLDAYPREELGKTKADREFEASSAALDAEFEELEKLFADRDGQDDETEPA